MQSSKSSLMLAVLGVFIAGAYINPRFTCMAKADSQPATLVAVRKWQDKQFGMFIHWGPVIPKGTQIGWSRGKQVSKNSSVV